MADIVLVALNARYAHTAFGLRYLKANLGALRERAVILEFDLTRDPVEVVAAILRHSPRIVGLSVFIWNVTLSTAVAAVLKRLAPEVRLVLGGPEVSHETAAQRITTIADHVICGEGDVAFARLCDDVLAGREPGEHVVVAVPPSFDQLCLPYELYDDQDVARRVLYVEVSRGCPFECEFCLSSLDASVRYAPLNEFLSAMQRLLDRGALRFKFVDRTFNLNLRVAQAVLGFFRERVRPGLSLHFEMVPDRFAEGLRDLVRRFPPGCLQFEVGIQTLTPQVAHRLSRHLDVTKLEDNLRFLRSETNVHVHADLIAGLPGESVSEFAAGFDRLIALAPQEIQIELLKRLRGTPITRHDDAHGMVYSPEPPYEVLATRAMDFATLRRVQRFSRYWDLTANSGNFVTTLPLLWSSAERSPFTAFMNFADWLHERAGRAHAIALLHLMEHFFLYLTTVMGLDPERTARDLWLDYQRGGRSDRPHFLLPYIAGLKPESPRGLLVGGTERQQRHERRRVE